MELEIVILELAVALRVIAPELHRTSNGKHSEEIELCNNPYCKLVQTAIAHSEDWHERIGYEEAQQILRAEHKEHNK